MALTGLITDPTVYTYNKLTTSIQTGGVVYRTNDVVLDKISGMWYQWTGAVPYTFTPAASTPAQSFQGWICRGYLKEFTYNDPRNFGAHANTEFGFTTFDSTNAIQLMIDSARYLTVNAGTNYSLQYASRGHFNLGGLVYNTSRPIEIQDDLSVGLRASGIRVENGGLRALPGFTPAVQKKNLAGDSRSISAFFILGAKNYGFQSGHYVSYIKIQDMSFEGNNFSCDAVIWADVVAHCFVNNIEATEVKYCITGNVVSFSQWTNLRLVNTNSVVTINNTSVADGYNSGLGLEGGGNHFTNITIIGDGFNDPAINRFHFIYNGEFNISNVISYNGRGNFLVANSLPGGDTGTQSKWSRLLNCEVGDLAGQIANLSYVSNLQFEANTVRCGTTLGGAAALLHIDNCDSIDIHPNFDNFYDTPSAWREVIEVVDSSRVNIHQGSITSIPAANNAFSMIAFKGNSQRCNVGPLSSNIAVASKLYIYPVSSEATCAAIAVIGGSFVNGAFISGTPDLKGAGDSFTGINTGTGAPADSARITSDLTSGNTIGATYRDQQFFKTAVPAGGVNLTSINFVDANIVHNAEIEVNISAASISGNASWNGRFKLRFVRDIGGSGRVNVSSALEVFADGSVSTLSIALTETHTQYGVVINAIPTFGGVSAESACNIVALVRTNSAYRFTG